jgi:hypothetical protein
MLKINDSVEFSRTAAAVSLVLGALCFLAAGLVEPAWAPDARAYLDEIAAASNRYQASGVLNALGSTATVFGLIGVLHLLRGRRVTLGQLGAGLVIMGSVLLAGHWLIVLVETAGAQVDPDRALKLLTTASESRWAALLEVGGLGSTILGPVLLAVGLWTRRATPVWVPIVLLLYAAVPFFPSDGPAPGTYQWRTSSQAIAVVSSALLGAALVGLALRVLSLPGEAWARWQPLPDPPRRRLRPPQRTGRRPPGRRRVTPDAGELAGEHEPSKSSTTVSGHSVSANGAGTITPSTSSGP